MATSVIQRRQPAAQAELTIGTAADSAEPTFKYVGEARFDAKMRLDGVAFVVLEGSRARVDGTPGCADSIKALRARAREAGILVQDAATNTLVVTRDFPVGSTSAAGGLIGGRNSRGPNEWVHADTRQSYAQWLSAKQTIAPLLEGSLPA